MTETYVYHWICKSCEHENKFERTKFEAAFDHRPQRAPCTRCGGTEYSSAGTSLPQIDTELLEAWYADTNLFFLEQDEDLIIADTGLEILKTFIEKKDGKEQREISMGPIFAVKLFDDNFNNPDERKWCVNWLARNKDKWIESTDSYITKDVKRILKKEYINDKK